MMPITRFPGSDAAVSQVVQPRFDAPVTETRARTVILHGSADNLAPLEALDAMLSTTDFDYELGEDGVILIRPRGPAL